MRSNELHSNLLLSNIADNSYVGKYGLSILFRRNSPDTHMSQLTPICNGFLEYIDNNGFCYFLTEYIKGSSPHQVAGEWFEIKPGNISRTLVKCKV